MSSNLASFAPYAPPPDDPPSLSAPRTSRAWFPSAAETSYQSGGIPTFGTSQAGGAGAVEAAESQQNVWLTRIPLRVDVLAAFTYVLGPISAFLILILETQNDYVRFHGYQAALLTTPLLVVRIFMSLFGFWQWLRSLFTFAIVALQLFMAFRAFVDASGSVLSRYHLPYVGYLAEDWLAEE